MGTIGAGGRRFRHACSMRWRPLLGLTGVLVALAGASVAAPTSATPARTAQVSPPGGTPAPPADPPPERIRWRRSRAVGKPFRGRLVRGVRLPREGPDFATWDPALDLSPNRASRRWGTDRLLRVLLRVLRAYGEEFPTRPARSWATSAGSAAATSEPVSAAWATARTRTGLTWTSTTRGSTDVRWPRSRVGQVDLPLAQELVDLFVCAGAEYVFVGPSTPLTGPRGVVRPLVHHDDHMHVRIYPKGRRRAKRSGCA